MMKYHILFHIKIISDFLRYIAHCVAEIGHFQFVILSLRVAFQGQVKDPKLALEKKHLLLAVTKLMTKACPGAILPAFLPKNLEIGKAEHRTSLTGNR